MYRKLLFFAWVNYLQVWWAGLAHWRVTRDTGVCSWEQGRERLPLDWHQGLELALSYLGTFILWELSSPNDTAGHFFCCHTTHSPAPGKKKNGGERKQTKTQRTNKQNLCYPLLSVSWKTWGLKRFRFLEVGALVFESRLYFKKFWFE